jgi:hypothetical protein
LFVSCRWSSVVSGANLGRWLLISSGDRGEVIGDRGPRGDVTHAVAGFAAAGSPESPAPPLLSVVVIVVVVVVPLLLLLLVMRSALLSAVSLLPLLLRLTVDGEASGDDGCDPPESLPLPRSFLRPNDRRCLGDDASSLSLPLAAAASSPWLLPLSLVRDRAEPRRPLRPPRPSPPLPRCLRPVSSAAVEEASADCCCCWSSSSSSGRVAKVPERRAHRLPFFSRGRCGVANRKEIIIH